MGHAYRANRKLFTSKILVSNSTTYTHISQKILKAMAARCMLYWITPVLVEKAKADDTNDELKSFNLSERDFVFCLQLWILHVCFCENLRNLKCWLRDRANVFLSLLTLYQTFSSNKIFVSNINLPSKMPLQSIVTNCLPH